MEYYMEDDLRLIGYDLITFKKYASEISKNTFMEKLNLSQCWIHTFLGSNGKNPGTIDIATLVPGDNFIVGEEENMGDYMVCMPKITSLKIGTDIGADYVNDIRQSAKIKGTFFTDPFGQRCFLSKTTGHTMNRLPVSGNSSLERDMYLNKMLMDDPDNDFEINALMRKSKKDGCCKIFAFFTTNPPVILLTDLLREIENYKKGEILFYKITQKHTTIVWTYDTQPHVAGADVPCCIFDVSNTGFERNSVSCGFWHSDINRYTCRSSKVIFGSISSLTKAIDISQDNLNELLKQADSEDTINFTIKNSEDVVKMVRTIIKQADPECQVGVKFVNNLCNRIQKRKFKKEMSYKELKDIICKEMLEEAIQENGKGGRKIDLIQDKIVSKIVSEPVIA